MDIVQLWKLAGAARGDLEGLLSVVKMQNYNRPLDARAAEMAMTILLREDSDETVTQLMKSLDAFVLGVSELKAEIALRRLTAK